MVSRKLAKLIKEVFVYYGERKEKMAKNDPEGCLISLLLSIKEGLEDRWSVGIDTVVRRATYEENVNAVREKLKKHNRSKKGRLQKFSAT